MKTLNGKKVARTAGIALTALFAALNLAGCGSSSSGSSTTALPLSTLGTTSLTPGFGGIGTLTSGYTSVATSLSTMTYNGTPALQIGLQFATNGSSLLAQGYLYNTVNWIECGLPPGSYTLTSTQGGAISSGIFTTGMILQATAATGTFQVMIMPQDFFTPKTQVGPDGTTFPYALQGYIEFAVNGQVCNNQLAY